jgi:hypothetical protein
MANARTLCGGCPISHVPGMSEERLIHSGMARAGRFRGFLEGNPAGKLPFGFPATKLIRETRGLCAKALASDYEIGIPSYQVHQENQMPLTGPWPMPGPSVGAAPFRMCQACLKSASSIVDWQELVAFEASSKETPPGSFLLDFQLRN